MSCCQIGKMRHRVVVQSFIETQDDAGQPIKTYSDLDTVWAKVTPLTGKERVEAAQVRAEVTHSVMIRYRAGLKPKMRLVYDGQILEIAAVINLREEDRWMQIACIERIEEEQQTDFAAADFLFSDFAVA